MLFYRRIPIPRIYLILILQFTLLFLVFFRPGVALRMSGAFDEPCYLAWTEWLTGDFTATCEGKQHFGGIAFLWIPFALLGKCFAQITGTSLDEAVVFFVGLSSFFYLALSVLILYRIMERALDGKTHLPAKVIDWAPFLFICTSPVIYYATVRTLLPHSGEIFLAALVILLVLKRKVYEAAGVALLLCFTRPQNLGCMMYVMTLLETSSPRKKVLQVLGIFLFVGLSVYLLSIGYHQTFLLPSLLQVSLRKVALFFLQVDFGILWTQPIWLVAFVSGLLLKNPTPSQRGLWCWLLISALSCIVWPTNGSSYGFRYLIGSYAAAWLLLLELVAQGHLRKTLTMGLVLASTWNLALVWAFPAPPPLWLWSRPSALSIGWPFGILSSWLNNPGTFFSMLQFSPVGLLCEMFHYCSNIEFQFMNEVLKYHLTGPLRFLLAGITFALIICGLLVLLILSLSTESVKKIHKTGPG